eukprot:gene4674-5121_t
MLSRLSVQTRRHFVSPLRSSVRAMAGSKIVYTETDEAPALATYSLLPIVQKFAGKAGIDVEKCDISLAARIVSQFSDRLSEEQRLPDNLALLGELCKKPEANIIKLPNISASVPQLNEAITELRTKGFDVPLYVANPTNDREKEIHKRYAKVLGSAVNPVIREGNSDRRVAAPVKNYAKKNPHTLGMWSKASRSHVAHMTQGDFYGTEQSYVLPQADVIRVELVDGQGATVTLKEGLKVLPGEVIDTSFLSVREFCTFLEKELEEAYKEHVLFSIHLKATMMKVSDPVIFGHAVRVFFRSVFEKHDADFKSVGVNPNYGVADLLEKIKRLPVEKQNEIQADLQEAFQHRPWLAMVDSARGITNLHVPNDVIIDASMPVVIRDSGKMWNKDGALEDVKCVIPDRSYALIYQEIMSYCKSSGQFDVSTMGSVSNVGLMAQKAEEYGSHDKTFEVPRSGTVRVLDSAGKVIFSHAVEAGDIWRMCQTKDVAIRDWVKLAVKRARASQVPAIFWLDERRAHDRSLIEKVQTYLKEHDTAGLDISIMSPVHAMRRTCERAKEGLDTISVTGNVLRDYLTDLFPILELGTSAKMLSIVPLLAGGGLFETGAGGSAPKHVQQFLKEGHLRWDSLGEYLAIAVSFEHLADVDKNSRALALSESLNQAIERLLENRKSPGRKVNQLDNRASNFYVALYWAEFMARKDPSYEPLASALRDARSAIVAEFKTCQGHQVDIGGYYRFDERKAAAAMRPSPTFNRIIDSDL